MATITDIVIRKISNGYIVKGVGIPEVFWSADKIKEHLGLPAFTVIERWTLGDERRVSVEWDYLITSK